MYLVEFAVSSFLIAFCSSMWKLEEGFQALNFPVPECSLLSIQWPAYVDKKEGNVKWRQKVKVEISVHLYISLLLLYVFTWHYLPFYRHMLVTGWKEENIQGPESSGPGSPLLTFTSNCKRQSKMMRRRIPLGITRCMYILLSHCLLQLSD